MITMETLRRARAALSFDSPIPKPVRIALNSALVLLLLFLAIGLAYTYFGKEAGDTALTVPAAQVNPIPKPTIPAQDAKVGAAVQMLTSPVPPGSDVAMTVRTLPGATCEITAVYDEVSSKDSRLVAKVADEYGMVNWKWVLESDVPLGTWPVTVTCSRNGRSGVVVGNLQVANGTVSGATTEQQ